MQDNFYKGTTLSFYNVYGPKQSPITEYAATVPKFIQQMLAGVSLAIFGDRHQKRDFLFVSEVRRACPLAAEIPQAGGLEINVCSGETVSILEVVETLSGILAGETLTQFAPGRAGDILISMGDTTRAEQVLGSTSGVSLAQGLARTVDWIQT
jgi:UDP-glucose 4-epimerase